MEKSVYLKIREKGSNNAKIMLINTVNIDIRIIAICKILYQCLTLRKLIISCSKNISILSLRVSWSMISRVSVSVEKFLYYCFAS